MSFTRFAYAAPSAAFSEHGEERLGAEAEQPVSRTPAVDTVLGHAREVGNRAVTARLQRRCAHCTSGGAPCEHCAPPSVRTELASSGAALAPTARDAMQAQFGQDFSHVRVHSGSAAAASATDVGALAYTVGSHIVFGDGGYAPETQRGQRLLAHELTHVVQQRRAHVDLDRLHIDTSTSSPAEREAAAASTVAHGERAAPAHTARQATVQRAVMVNDEEAGGCGICHGPQEAGRIVHALVQTEFHLPEILKMMDPAAPANHTGDVPFIELDLRKLGSAPGDDNGRLDLAKVDDAGDIYIGEIKPANDTQVKLGTDQLDWYAKKIKKQTGRTPKRLQDRIDMSFVVMPNPQIKDCPREQFVRLNPPTSDGLYTYYCKPSRAELWKDPTCRCWEKRKKDEKEDRKRKPKEDAPDTYVFDEVKTGQRPVAERPIDKPVDEPVKEPARQPEGPEEKPVDEPSDPVESPDVEPDVSPNVIPIRRPQPGHVPVEEALPIAAMVAAAAIAIKMLPKGVAKRFLGPAYAAAFVLLLAKGAHAEIRLDGSGDDALEALFKNASNQGAEIPEDIKEQIRKDPELKKILSEAATTGKFDAAQQKIGEKITRTIIENRDKFSDEEMEELAKIAKDAGGAVPNSEKTVEEIKKAIADHKAGKKPGTQGQELPVTPTNLTPEPETADPTAETKQAAEPPGQPLPVAVPAELKERLAKNRPASTLIAGLLLPSLKGPKATPQLIEKVLGVIEAANPPLSEEEAEDMVAHAVAADGKTEAEVLDAIQKALTKRKSAQAEGDTGEGTGETPEDKKPEEPGAIAVDTIDTSDAGTKVTPGEQARGKRLGSELRAKQNRELFEKIPPHSAFINYTPPSNAAPGAKFSAAVVGRDANGQIFLGEATVTLGTQKSATAFAGTVNGGVKLFTDKNEVYGTLPTTPVELDWTAWAEAQKAKAKGAKKKK